MVKGPRTAVRGKLPLRILLDCGHSLAFHSNLRNVLPVTETFGGKPAEFVSKRWNVRRTFFEDQLFEWQFYHKKNNLCLLFVKSPAPRQDDGFFEDLSPWSSFCPCRDDTELLACEKSSLGGYTKVSNKPLPLCFHCYVWVWVVFEKAEMINMTANVGKQKQMATRKWLIYNLILSMTLICCRWLR